MSRDNWKRTPITLEQWKANCHTSNHRRPNDTIRFHERDGVINAFVQCDNHNSIFIGAFWINGDDLPYGILPSTGWNHK